MLDAELIEWLATHCFGCGDLSHEGPCSDHFARGLNDRGDIAIGWEAA